MISRRHEVEAHEPHNKEHADIESWMDLIDIDNIYINIDEDASYNILYRNIIREEFYVSIDRLCDSFASLTKSIKDPIEHQTFLINKRIIHSSEFTLYVNEVDNFNNTIRHIISLLNDMITSLHSLFTRKKKRYFIGFIDHSYQFILYLLINDVFTHIKRFKTKLDKQASDGVTKVKILIFDIFNILLDIAGLFIPQFIIVKKSCNILENHINKRFSIIRDILDENEHNAYIDNIVRQILNIQPRTELNTSFKKIVSFTNLIKLDNDRLIMSITALQNDYSALVNSIDTLGNEIINYRNERSIIDRIMRSMRML
jgi:hypothetical protein